MQLTGANKKTKWKIDREKERECVTNTQNKKK